MHHAMKKGMSNYGKPDHDGVKVAWDSIQVFLPFEYLHIIPKSIKVKIKLYYLNIYIVDCLWKAK